MTDLWKQWEGVSLADTYGLEQWLGSDPSGAFFSTTFGGRRAVLKLEVEEDRPAPDAQLALWQRTMPLSHPNLLPLLDCGRTEADGGSLVFAVFEAPDDSLTAAIENGPLSEEEARAVLEASADALQYLHAHGLAHTSIDAEHIVAVGDRIKLSSDTLRDANGRSDAPGNDVWALGALIYELATKRRIEPGETPDLTAISDPLRTMIQNAVEPDSRYRWTASQLLEALRPGRTGDPPANVEPVEAEHAAELRLRDEETRAVEEVADEATPVAGPGPVEEERVAAASGPAHEEYASTGHEPASAGLERRDTVARAPAIMVHEPFSIVGKEEAAAEPPQPTPPQGPTPPSPISRYVPIGAVALVALLAVIFVIEHHGTQAPPAVAIMPPPVAETPPPARVIPASTPKETNQTWRVIAYTYARNQDAEKKAQFINSRFADLHAEVFKPASRSTSYLISLGGRLTREEAAALQRKAIGKGLPRDTYIQNFSN
jgi:hypothetical protein